MGYASACLWFHVTLKMGPGRSPKTSMFRKDKGRVFKV